MKRKSLLAKTSISHSIFKIKRRDFLAFLGSGTIVSLFGCGQPHSGPSAKAQPTASSQSGCVVSPRQTEGPFFVEEALNRKDIRSDPSTDVVKEGVLLRLKLRVSQVEAAACVPIVGAVVDIWHCDAEGVYSDVGNATGQKFLRGSQTTDAEGLVEFVTVYPGWYPGRAPHVHIKVRGETGSQGYEFASQLYFDEGVSDRIYIQSPYSRRKQRSPKNESDFLYQNGGEQLILNLASAEDGYTGTFDIGLQMA